MKRRDLLEASKLLARHKMDRTDPAAMSLAAAYISEKRDGETELGFQEWLDTEMDDDEVDALGDGGAGGESDPT